MSAIVMDHALRRRYTFLDFLGSFRGSGAAAAAAAAAIGTFGCDVPKDGADVVCCDIAEVPSCPFSSFVVL